MRLWAQVYDSSSTLLAYLPDLISASVTSKLDQAGSFDLQCPLDEAVIDYLVTGNEVALMVQDDAEASREWTRGKITSMRVRESAGTLSISISGRDLLEELRYYTVGLGRAYTAQTAEVIIDDLLSLVSGWAGSYDATASTQLQTARYDGAKVLKAVVRTVEELGLHFRLGGTRVLEVGAFGESLTVNSNLVRAIRPPSSITRELYDNDAVLLIDDISVSSNVDSLVNWAIPLGAGEGVAATTLKNTTYEILNTDNTTYQAGTAPDYPIYRRVNDFAIAEYYVDASEGDALHQDTLSFKEIGPLANSDAANAAASDALARATFESLRRTRTAITSLEISVKKARVTIQPGDLIRVTYKGVVKMAGNPKSTRAELTYINVDADYWVMGVRQQISEGGITTTLTVNTIDQHLIDDKDILVEVLDRTQVQNVAVKTRTTSYEKTYYDNVGYQRPATFRFRAKNTVTDVVAVLFSFRTIPLDATTASIWIAPSTFQLWWQETDGYNYPSDVSIWINGVDVTSELAPGGVQWNDGGTNAALDVQDLDITSYIIANGIHNETTVQIMCDVRVGEVRFNSGYVSLIQAGASCGRVEAMFNITTNVRDVIPAS